MPPVFPFLKTDKVQSLDWRLSLLNPFKNELKCPILRIERVSFKQRLHSDVVIPSDRVTGQHGVIRLHPLASMLLADSPMKQKVLIEILVLGDDVNRVPIDHLLGLLIELLLFLLIDVIFLA